MPALSPDAFITQLARTLAPLYVIHGEEALLALEAASWDQGVALINDYMLQPEDPGLVRLPLHALETGDNFYFVCKRSRAHEPAISRLRQWLWQEAQASLRPGESEPLRRV